MRGLPPIPSGVGRLTQGWEADGNQMSTSWWVLVNLGTPINPADLAALLTDYTLYALPNLLDSMSDVVSPTTCRLSVSGLTEVQHNPPAHGAFGGGAPASTASGIIWTTGDAGRKGWAITYLPGTPTDFYEGQWQLSAEGYRNVLDSATNFKLQLETLPLYPPDTLVLGSLLRARNGAPRPSAVFRPFVNWRPSPKLVTIRRRIPPRQSVLPF